MLKYPYDTDYMIYDFENHRYVSTLKCVTERLGIDFTQRAGDNGNRIPAILNQISRQIYAFIHSHNVNDAYQDAILAKTESGRKIIQEAMEQQIIYVLAVGDLSRSTDIAKRALKIDDTAIETLLKVIPELGCSILYCGNLPYVALPPGQW